MIKLKNLEQSEPYILFNDFYKKAIRANQSSIDAISISSYNKKTKEVDSRYVNLKFIDVNKWTFFSNYNSNKATQFESHNQISALIYWNSIGVQIRIKGNITKSDPKVSDEHFAKRDKFKNALAISSHQSKETDSYEHVLDEFNNVLNSEIILTDRPEYWGGFSFTPYYFEFWQGHESRINKRNSFKIIKGKWTSFFLEP